MLMTACNEDVQRYIEQPNKSNKNKILAEIKETALSEGINFNKLFKKGTKRHQVLDTIIYLLSSGGICKISSTKLAEKVGGSESTIFKAVKDIKKLGAFTIGGLADGKNKYIFVYKKHPDFREILANVFYLNSEKITEQVTGQGSARTTDNKEIEDEKTNSILNNNTFSKQEKDNIRESIENELLESPNKNQRTKEYLINPYQKMLCDAIETDNFLHPKIRKVAPIIALRAGSNCNEKTYRIALKAISKVDKAIYMGTTINSIPAVFTKIYTDRITYRSYYEAKQPERKPQRNTSYLYDWLKTAKEE